MSFDPRFSDVAVTLVFKMNIGHLCKSVQYHKACVVTGSLIFITWIPQSTNQEFIHFDYSAAGASSSAVAAAC